MANTRRIKKESTSQMVLKAIKEDIFTKRLLPGQKITLGELAEQFGVSITPVREALLALEKEHLVKTTPYKETVVMGLDEKYIEDSYQIRGALEGFTVYEVCREQKDLSEVEERYQVMEQVMREERYGDYSAANRGFHEAIWRASDNMFVCDMLMPLWINNSTAVIKDVKSNAEVSFQEHTELMQLLRARDAQGARACMEHHISRSKEDFKRHFQNN